MEEEAEQAFEIDINESEPPFLAGQTAFGALPEMRKISNICKGKSTQHLYDLQGR